MCKGFHCLVMTRCWTDSIWESIQKGSRSQQDRMCGIGFLFIPIASFLFQVHFWPLLPCKLIIKTWLVVDLPCWRRWSRILLVFPNAHRATILWTCGPWVRHITFMISYFSGDCFSVHIYLIPLSIPNSKQNPLEQAHLHQASNF